MAVSVVPDDVLAEAGLTGQLASVTAVALNVTATDAAGEGYVSVFAGGQGWPGSSNLNVEYVGQTVPNLVTTPVGPGGTVNILASVGTHLVADIQGLYVATAGAATAGRFVPLTPSRVYDTRLPGYGGPLQPGVPRSIPVTAAGVPVDATAVVLNVTSVASPADQFVTVWPTGRARPLASNLNVRPGQTVANAVISGLGGGIVDAYSPNGGDVVVDVAGYFTGTSQGASSDGLFVPVTPARVADTRLPSSPTRGDRPEAKSTIEVDLNGRGGLPAGGYAAVALNVTATGTGGQGYVTVWGGGTTQPGTSSLNPERSGQTVPNQVITPVTTAGVDLFTLSDAHLVVDVFGYYTGTQPYADARGPYTVASFGDVKPGPQPPAPPASGPHTFLYQISGGYARWNPCAVLRYKVNADKALPGQRALLADVILEAEAATGVDFVYAGDFSGPALRVPPAGADAVISFVNLQETPLESGSVGVGGGQYQDWGGGVGKVVNGFAMFSNAYGTSSLQRDLMLHEIGHMLGLGHIQDPSQVMNPYVVDVPHYSNGDRQGLWQLGAAQGCIATGYDFGGPDGPDTGPLAGDDIPLQTASTAG
jgi:hypothetical protein